MEDRQRTKSRMIQFISGLIVGLLIAATVPLILLFTGTLNMAASQKPGQLETKFGTLAWKTSMLKRAPNIKNPYANDPQAISRGLTLFKQNCVSCHGASGVPKSAIAKGLNPPAPGLDYDYVQDLSDGQLFWIVKNGIRMTGMPAFGPSHQDQEIWQTVTFIRHLLDLSPEEKTALHQ